MDPLDRGVHTDPPPGTPQGNLAPGTGSGETHVELDELKQLGRWENEGGAVQEAATPTR